MLKKLDKLAQEEKENLLFDLINAFSLMKNPVESALFLNDLLTENEIENLARRLRVGKLLLVGETHEEVVRKLHCSYTTVAKIAMWINNSGEGLKRIIKRLPRRRKAYIPKKIPGIGYGLPQILLALATLALTEKEKKGLAKFVEQMHSKTSLDRDFREEIDLEFASNKIKRKK